MSTVAASRRWQRSPGSRAPPGSSWQSRRCPMPTRSERSGKVLLEVLELADRLPSKRRGELTYPPLIRLRVVIGLGDRMLAVHDALRARRHPARDRRRDRSRLLHARAARHAGRRRQRVRRARAARETSSPRCPRASSVSGTRRSKPPNAMVRSACSWDDHADRPVLQRAAVPRRRRAQHPSRALRRAHDPGARLHRRWPSSRRCSIDRATGSTSKRWSRRARSTSTRRSAGSARWSATISASRS